MVRVHPRPPGYNFEYNKIRMNQLLLAGCIIINNDNEILLLHRNAPNRAQWETPGGKVEKNETPRACAIREAEEELGVKIEIIKELGRKKFREDQHIMVYIWFLAKIINGEPRVMEAKHDDLDFWTWEEIKHKKDLSPNTQNLVKAYLNHELSL